MKKLSIAIAITCMCLVLKAQYNSSDGDGIQPTGTYRTLNIFINIIYDKTPASNPFPNNDVAWPYTNIEGVTTTGPTRSLRICPISQRLVAICNRHLLARDL